MSLVFRERNDRRYVYRSTSRREPGRRNPVTEKDYLGVVDPETGLVDMKPMPLDELSLFLTDGGFRVRDRGSVLVAGRVAESMGIADALDYAFGGCGRCILAMAVCYAIAPAPIGDPVRMTRRFDLTDILGRDAMTRDDLDAARRAIGDKSMIGFAESLMEGRDGFPLFGRNAPLGGRSSRHPIGTAAPCRLRTRRCCSSRTAEGRCCGPRSSWATTPTSAPGGRPRNRDPLPQARWRCSTSGRTTRSPLRA